MEGKGDGKRSRFSYAGAGDEEFFGLIMGDKLEKRIGENREVANRWRNKV